RIDDGDPLNLATVVHVFGIEFSASKRASRRDDGAVPVGKPVRRFDFQCASKDREGDFLNLEPRPRGKKAYGGLVRQRAGPRGSRRLTVEFLEHLHRQSPIVSTQQRDGSLSLEGVR